jgi:hypothetical protein
LTEAAKIVDYRNSIDQLIHEIPGVPPRDPNIDALLGFLGRDT